ncbi:hypothetical protein T492DRAFT_1098980 [Pavlovales sp. CCMP2436]|nr:hypothetical protein T492DRAFT_1098980 [Pavlovales sp. CCMP2436]|mmetsp:Transcript_29567/g.74331  ORF Transcript_29567/g.74331 Transcript_29567/m.74331 type:complete len:164 (-) Transcript_29567:254-745(-)
MATQAYGALALVTGHPLNFADVRVADKRFRVDYHGVLHLPGRNGKQFLAFVAFAPRFSNRYGDNIQVCGFYETAEEAARAYDKVTATLKPPLPLNFESEVKAEESTPVATAPHRAIADGQSAGGQRSLHPQALQLEDNVKREGTSSRKRERVDTSPAPPPLPW